MSSLNKQVNDVKFWFSQFQFSSISGTLKNPLAIRTIISKEQSSSHRRVWSFNSGAPHYMALLLNWHVTPKNRLCQSLLFCSPASYYRARQLWIFCPRSISQFWDRSSYILLDSIALNNLEYSHGECVSM